MRMISEKIADSILNAEAKALATTGPNGVNVVPVSVVKLEGDSIYLYNFFMGKTVENLVTEERVALTCWSGLEGVQVKAKAEYHATDKIFEEAEVEMKEQFPDRVLKGVIVLKPHSVYDISVGLERAGKLLSSN